MTNTLTNYWNFLWAGFLKHGQTGSLVPPQRFLIAKMIAPVPKAYRGQLIELGGPEREPGHCNLRPDALKHESWLARSIPL